MRRPSMHYIQDLTAREISLLTQVLCLPKNSIPTQIWLDDQAQKIGRLPKALLKPHSLFPRIFNSMKSAEENACLCKAHKSLNPYLIRRIFLQVSGECTKGVARLAENPYLPSDLTSFLKRIHLVNSLWMAPDMYRTLYSASFHDARYERIESGCEACILATVGGNAQILCDLRTSMLGRRKKRKPIARFLRLVDAWIDGTQDMVLVRAYSDKLGREVREGRRQMQYARRQTRRNIKEGIREPTPERRDASNTTGSTDALLASVDKDGGDDDEDEDQGHYFEDSIINEYLARYSTSVLALERPKPADMHPAFRISIFFDGPSGTFKPKGKTPEPPPVPQRPQSQLTQCTQWPVFAENLAQPSNARPGSAQAQQRVEKANVTKPSGGSRAYSAHDWSDVSSLRDSSEAWAKDYRDLLAPSPESDELNNERASCVSEPADGGWI